MTLNGFPSLHLNGQDLKCYVVQGRLDVRCGIYSQISMLPSKCGSENPGCLVIQQLVELVGKWNRWVGGRQAGKSLLKFLLHFLVKEVAIQKMVMFLSRSA